MLRSIHKFKRGTLRFVAIGMIILAMSGFGVNILNNRQIKPAIQVDEVEIEYDDFYRQYNERRAMIERYRSMLGEKFEQLAAQFNLNATPQSVAEGIITSTLMESASQKIGFSVGSEQLKDKLIEMISQMGGGSFDPNVYRSYLNQLGVSSQEFEKRLAQDLLRENFNNFLFDASYVSTKEAESLMQQEETQYHVKYLIFSADKFQNKVKEPSPEELAKLYEDTAANYEVPPQASYDYIVLESKDFVKEVKVSPEEVELYYADNTQSFQTPPQYKVRHIQLNFPKENSPTKMAEVKESANKLHEKIVAGEDFGALAKAESDDISSKVLGGDLGWISQGKMDKNFDAALLKLAVGETSEVISTDYGYHIIRLEERKDSNTRPLEEVRSEIERILREREAPAWAATRADEYYISWTKDGTLSLVDFAASKGLKVESTKGLVTAGQDPSTELKGLGARLPFAPDEGAKKQLIDMGDRWVLVGLKEYKPAEIPSLESIKSKLVSRFKAQGAAAVAQESASKTLEGLKSGTYANMAAAAKAMGLTVEDKKDFNSKFTSGIFGIPEVRSVIFSTQTPASNPDRIIRWGNGAILLAVTEVTKPKPEDLKGNLESYREQQRRESGELLVKSLTNTLRAKATILVDDAIYREG